MYFFFLGVLRVFCLSVFITELILLIKWQSLALCTCLQCMNFFLKCNNVTHTLPAESFGH